MNRVTQRILRLTTFASFSAAFAIALAPPALGGAVTCSYDSGTGVVTATADPNNNQMALRRNGDEITVSGIDCGEATRFNTDSIVLNDVASHDLDVFVNETYGPFRPGEADEPGSSDEIEIEVNLGNGDNSLTVTGVRNVRAGVTFTGSFSFERRVNTNAKETTGVDHDIDMSGGPDYVYFLGTNSDDRINAAGGKGTGIAYFGKTYLNGVGGRDVLKGGTGEDDIFGYKKADTLRGGAGEDVLYGHEGADTLRGNGDNDLLFGHAGNDDLNGGGSDDCNAGEGTNIVANCE